MRFRRVLVGLAALLCVCVFGVGSAAAQGAFHGIVFAKGCDSPTAIGSPLNCAYTVLNTVDTAHDTLTISGLSDTVHAASGDTSSGNILSALQLVFNGAVTCTGGSGAGTAGSPYVGATSCTLPFGTSIVTNPHSFYTVQAGDFALPNNTITDTATLNWADKCDGTSNNCSQSPQTITAGSSSLVEKFNSQTATTIHNAVHQAVTTVEAGSIVHDFVTVTGLQGQPKPSGTVTIRWYTNGTCSSEVPAATSGPETLDANGQVDATDFPQGPLSAGMYGFRASYGGDNTYLPSVGDCEPLQVVDANIQITPNGINHVGQTHTFTAHVNVNDGSGNGFVNAPAGTQINFTIDSGPGSFTSANPCTTVGTTGSCTINLTSAVTGVSTVRAHVMLQVGGTALTRSTDGTGANSGPALKRWVNASITIAPNATNEVGHSHTFTVTVLQDQGDGDGSFAAPDVTVTVTLTDANGAVHTAPTGTCVSGTTNQSGQCTITFLSNTAGTVTAHASATLSVSDSAPFTIQTDGVAPNSGNAVKTFVDANIQITPQNAINPVSTNHTLTGHVNVNAGSGFANAAAGTVITFSLTNSGGATAAFVGPNTCNTVGTTGSCTVVISSSTAGSTTVKATTTVSVGGLQLTRTTGDAKAGDSADANKLWAGSSVRTDILNASGTVVTEVVSGTVVHDKVFVTRDPNTSASIPNPTGTVIFHRYTTGNCSGTSTDQSVALTQGNPATAVSADFAPTAPTADTMISYKADYSGDANYPAGSGACEPLTVHVQPNPAIAIVKNPKSQSIPVGATAKFTITVTNTGNTVLTNVTVTDPLSPNCNRTSAQLPALASMKPGDHVTYSCTRPNVQNKFTNQATATGTPPVGPNVTATDTAPVTVTRPFIIKKVHPKVTSHKRPKATG
jgi:uncharacterized repeat protein (TIGR01451 family)